MKVPVRIINRENRLSRNYTLGIELGLILSLSLFILIVKVQFNPGPEKEALAVYVQEEVIMEEIVQTKQEIKAPPPPRPVVPIEVPNSEIIEDEIIDLDAELDLDAPMDLPLPPRPTAQQEEEEEEIFIIVENPPVLIGGIASVQEQIVYPELALKAGIEGRVIVQFVVTKDGSISDPVVVRGIGGGCDQEAIRAVKLAKFQPGLQRGRPVSVRYSLPITFKIYNKDS